MADGDYLRWAVCENCKFWVLEIEWPQSNQWVHVVSGEELCEIERPKAKPMPETYQQFQLGDIMLGGRESTYVVDKYRGKEE